jgi:hypothetical protein
MHYIMPAWSIRLANLYYLLRFYGCRNQARRRKLYRQISHERKRLLGAGVDGEEVRLLCRHLANPSNRHAAGRLAGYSAQLRLEQGP